MFVKKNFIAGVAALFGVAFLAALISTNWAYILKLSKATNTPRIYFEPRGYTPDGQGVYTFPKNTDVVVDIKVDSSSESIESMLVRMSFDPQALTLPPAIVDYAAKVVCGDGTATGPLSNRVAVLLDTKSPSLHALELACFAGRIEVPFNPTNPLPANTNAAKTASITFNTSSNTITNGSLSFQFDATNPSQSPTSLIGLGCLDGTDPTNKCQNLLTSASQVVVMNYKIAESTAPTPTKTKAKLTLSSQNTTKTVDVDFDVGVLLNTGDYGTDQVDLVMQYDKTKLEAISIDNLNVFSLHTKTPPGTGIDTSQPSGTIKMSMSNELSNQVAVSGTTIPIAVASFKPKASFAQSEISVIFVPSGGSTFDSSVLDFETRSSLVRTDILGSVENLTISAVDVSTSTPTSTTTSTPTRSPTPSATNSPTPTRSVTPSLSPTTTQPAGGTPTPTMAPGSCAVTPNHNTYTCPGSPIPIGFTVSGINPALNMRAAIFWASKYQHPIVNGIASPILSGNERVIYGNTYFCGNAGCGSTPASATHFLKITDMPIPANGAYSVNFDGYGYGSLTPGRLMVQLYSASSKKMANSTNRSPCGCLGVSPVNCSLQPANQADICGSTTVVGGWYGWQETCSGYLANNACTTTITITPGHTATPTRSPTPSATNSPIPTRSITPSLSPTTTQPVGQSSTLTPTPSVTEPAGRAPSLTPTPTTNLADKQMRDDLRYIRVEIERIRRYIAQIFSFIWFRR